MIRLEAFTQGKIRKRPDTNEDSFVAMPGAGYAVIDGVTDRNGTTYDGMLSGRFASQVTKRAMETYLLAQSDLSKPTLHFRNGGATGLVSYLSGTIQSHYERCGMTEAARADWQRRASCAFIAAIISEGRMHLVSVGDCGFRMNLADVRQSFKPLDDIAALLRRRAWQHFDTLGMSVGERSRLALQVTQRGTGGGLGSVEHTPPDALAEIEREVLEECRHRFPAAPVSEIAELLKGGFQSGQGGFLNVDDRYLAYGALDGFAVPGKFVEHGNYRLHEIECFELFSDGYFCHGSTFGVDAWEQAFQSVEAADPYKVGDYMSTKGSTVDSFTDDRTYVGVRLR